MKTPKATDHRLKLPHRVTVLSSASAVLLLVAARQTTATALPAHATNWTPPAASYAASAPVHTTVTMDDGVKIAVEVVYPTDPSTGARASGPFPVLLTRNPYGAQRSDPTDSGTYFVQRGYIYVASAVRGTGDSGGQVDWFGDRQGKDGADLVDWAAHSLSGSNGKVGLDGCSYLGVDQWFTAAAVGKNSALKAITPFCTDSDFYNDLTGNGGIPTPFVAGIAQAEPRGPEDDPATDPQSVTVAQQASGGSRSYNDAYWQSLNVQKKLVPKIVGNGIPPRQTDGRGQRHPLLERGDHGRHADPHHRPAHQGGPAQRPDRRHPLRQVDDPGDRTLCQAEHRRPGRHGDQAGRRNPAGQPARPGHPGELVRRQRHPAQAESPLHPGVTAPGDTRSDHALRHLPAVQLHQDSGRLPDPDQHQQPAPGPTSTSPSPRPRRNWRTWPAASTPSSTPRRRRPSSTCLRRRRVRPRPATPTGDRPPEPRGCETRVAGLRVRQTCYSCVRAGLTRPMTCSTVSLLKLGVVSGRLSGRRRMPFRMISK